jgi:phosphotriesterase-related protein
MKQIQSVTGPLIPSELGLTLVHEHFRSRREPVMVAFPHVYDEELERISAIQAVRAAQSYGVTTICEPSVMGLGRDIRFIAEVAAETGANVVVATGCYTFTDLPQYFDRRPVSALVSALIHDIEIGIQGTKIKAGFLKCATDEPGITPGVEKVLRAVARAHRQSGVPIMTHSYPAGRTGQSQLQIFAEEGVDLRHVLVGHSGDTDDLQYLRDLLASGCYIGMDRYGLDARLPTSRRNLTVLELSRLGYDKQMLLSQDFVCTSDRYQSSEERLEAAPNWRMTYLFESVIPTLLEEGLPERAITQMMTGNPSDWLSPCDPY